MMDFVTVTLLLIGLATSWAFCVTLLYLVMKLESRVEFLEEWVDIEFEVVTEDNKDDF